MKNLKLKIENRYWNIFLLEKKTNSLFNIYSIYQMPIVTCDWLILYMSTVESIPANRATFIALLWSPLHARLYQPRWETMCPKCALWPLYCGHSVRPCVLCVHCGHSPCPCQLGPVWSTDWLKDYWWYTYTVSTLQCSAFHFRAVNIDLRTGNGSFISDWFHVFTSVMTDLLSIYFCMFCNYEIHDRPVCNWQHLMAS